MWLLRKWFSDMIINISHFFLIIGTIKMCLKKVKKTKRVQKGPKMKKRNEFRLTQQNGICGIHFEKFWFGSKENKFLKIPTLIRMYPKHVRKMGNRTRNFGISNALILTKIKFPKIFEDAAADILKAIDIKKDFLTPFCLYLGMTRPKQEDQGRLSVSRKMIRCRTFGILSDINHFQGPDFDMGHITDDGKCFLNLGLNSILNLDILKLWIFHRKVDILTERDFPWKWIFFNVHIF